MITVIVGGQYGSEAKGKVSLHLARTTPGQILVFRPGGTNSGHIGTTPEGTHVAFRQLPAAILEPRVRAVLPAGSYIDVPLLLEEIKKAGLSEDTSRLIIHPNASLITDAHKAQETDLVKAIGSTGSGTGASVLAAFQAGLTGDFSDAPLAKDCPDLAPWIGNVEAVIDKAYRANTPIIVEGTQGSGLSLTTSGNWPKCTSRDTNAAGFLHECGLAPTKVSKIFLVCRAHPIRVAGDSGDLPNEVDWATISKTAGRDVVERTTVTQNVRRVALFDPDVVKRAIQINHPTDIVLNHLDYIDGTPDITPAKLDYVREIEEKIGHKIHWLGTTPHEIVPAPNLD